MISVEAVENVDSVLQDSTSSLFLSSSVTLRIVSDLVATYLTGECTDFQNYLRMLIRNSFGF
jgi:hypothetical protein